MLIIKGKDKDGFPIQRQWHVGEPLPEVTGCVITFQADGDELDIILASLDRRYRYRKFEPDAPQCPKCGSYKLRCSDGHTWTIPTLFRS